MQALAACIGKALTKGDVVGLIGDLGTGKTTLSKGMGSALGVEGHMSSPSYTIVNMYACHLGALYHADVYRIDDVAQLDDIGFFDYLHEKGVVLVEWADKIKADLLLETDQYIELQLSPSASGEGRIVHVSGYAAFEERFKALEVNHASFGF